MAAVHPRWRVATLVTAAFALLAPNADGIVREQPPLAAVDRHGGDDDAVPLAWYLRLHHATGETVATGAGLAVHGTLAGLDAWSDRRVTLADREPGR